jgi:hypothetical protein
MLSMFCVLKLHVKSHSEAVTLVPSCRRPVAAPGSQRVHVAGCSADNCCKDAARQALDMPLCSHATSAVLVLTTIWS